MTPTFHVFSFHRTRGRALHQRSADGLARYRGWLTFLPVPLLCPVHAQ
jgi:hypothetical protein